jgi:hypothetical protein
LNRGPLALDLRSLVLGGAQRLFCEGAPVWSTPGSWSPASRCPGG